MDIALLIIGLIVILSAGAVFFYLGFVSGGVKELRSYVIVAFVLALLFIATMAVMKGPSELLNMSSVIAWMVGVGCGELRALLKARRSDK